jgi:glycosyltransferase involved in cell wall biosynthesis
MRIGFLGNPNNYPFMVALAMRRAGHDVQFIVDSMYMLHRPDAMMPEYRDGFPEWIHDCSRRVPRFSKAVQVEFLLTLMDASYRTRTHRRIVGILRSCDAVVVSGHGAAYLPEIDRPAFAMIVGYDLETLANPGAPKAIRERPKDRKYPFRLVLSALLSRVCERHRAGLRSVKAASYFLRGLVPYGDALLDELGITAERREFVMMTDTDRVLPAPAPANAVPRIFVGARLVWKKPLPSTMSALDDKASDVIVRGVAAYLRNGGQPVELVLVRKGNHVRETEELVREEGIERYVTWRDEMTHSEILEEYRAADIVVDQLGPAFFGMVALDAMACARPVIANGRPEILEPVLGAPSPLCQARTPEEVVAHLERLIPNAAERERVGAESRTYVEKYFSARRAADLIVSRLGRAA